MNHGDGLIFKSIFEESWTPIDLPAVESHVSRLRSAIAPLKGQPRFEKLFAEISPIPNMLREQIARIRTDTAFKPLPGGKIQWDREKDLVQAYKVSNQPILDGDFSKWESGGLYRLHKKSQIVDGEDLWKGPSQFSARAALAWDDENLYFAVDVTDPELYQPFQGRGVENGDTLRVILDTASPSGSHPRSLTGVFDLYLSPGNFDAVAPSVFCNEDFSPIRPRHDYDHEIHTNWKETATGFSGDVVVSATFFGREKFAAGQEIGMSFGVQKVFPPRDAFAEDAARIVFSFKESSLFPVESEHPATFLRMQLLDLSDHPKPANKLKTVGNFCKDQ